jgi:mannosyltransferase
VFSLIAAQRWITLERTASPFVASVINERARAGDIVVYCPDQVGPSTTRLIRETIGLREFTFPSGGSPRYVNWTDYAKRNEGASTLRFARGIGVYARASTIWYVWSPGYLTYGSKCEQLVTDLGRGRSPGRTVVPLHGKVEHVELVEYAPPS